MHYTASDTASSAVGWFLNPRSRASAHYVVDKDGTVHPVVPEGDVAWHAGTSLGPDGKGVNGYSIGIELVGRGDAYPKAQVDALVELIKGIKGRVPTLRWITGHEDVCVPKGRKLDPGPNFPMDEVARRTGLKVWRRNA